MPRPFWEARAVEAGESINKPILRRGYRLGVLKEPAYLTVVPHYITLICTRVLFIFVPCILRVNSGTEP